MIASQMPSLRAFLIFALVLLPPIPALAWNSAGHRLVAAIAWDQLDAHSRSEISQLLREHPDYERWIKKAGNDDPGRIAFIEASTWPDEIRKDNRFHNDDNGQTTPTLPGFPDMERHRNWHYVNNPLGAPHRQAISGLLDKQLPVLENIIGSPAEPGFKRSYALPWLIHLTGDAHQPLHTSTRLNAEGQWDKLGNGLNVINPFNPRKTASTLHAYWDDLPGPPWLRGARLNDASQALITLYPRQKTSSSAQWIEESWQIAKQSAYPPGNDKVPTISEEFYEKTKEITNRRIAQAGYRLADLLENLLHQN